MMNTRAHDIVDTFNEGRHLGKHACIMSDDCKCPLYQLIDPRPMSPSDVLHIANRIRHDLKNPDAADAFIDCYLRIVVDERYIDQFVEKHSWPDTIGPKFNGYDPSSSLSKLAQEVNDLPDELKKKVTKLINRFYDIAAKNLDDEEYRINAEIARLQSRLKELPHDRQFIENHRKLDIFRVEHPPEQWAALRKNK